MTPPHSPSWNWGIWPGARPIDWLANSHEQARQSEEHCLTAKWQRSVNYFDRYSIHLWFLAKSQYINKKTAKLDRRMANNLTVDRRSMESMEKVLRGWDSHKYVNRLKQGEWSSWLSKHIMRCKSTPPCACFSEQETKMPSYMKGFLDSQETNTAWPSEHPISLEYLLRMTWACQTCQSPSVLSSDTNEWGEQTFTDFSNQIHNQHCKTV